MLDHYQLKLPDLKNHIYIHFFKLKTLWFFCKSMHKPIRERVKGVETASSIFYFGSMKISELTISSAFPF